jgi:hypothetical protein
MVPLPLFHFSLQFETVLALACPSDARKTFRLWRKMPVLVPDFNKNWKV